MHGENQRETKDQKEPISYIQILYTNAQSICNKMDELKAHIVDLSPDIIMITESWTHSGITNAFLTIDGYTIVERHDRQDTTDGRGGGLLVYPIKYLVNFTN